MSNQHQLLTNIIDEHGTDSNCTPNFSFTGAQSLNLQEYIRTRSATTSTETAPENIVDDCQQAFDHITPEFICGVCQRQFQTSRGLNIHRSYHDKLSQKIKSKKIGRSRKGSQEPLIYDELELSDQIGINTDVISNSIIVNADIDSQPITPNEPESLRCIICDFIARSKGGLKCHARKHLRPSNSAISTDSEDKNLHECIAFYKQHIKLLNQIPRGARACAADKLAKSIDSCLARNDVSSWRNLFLFSYTSFSIPERDGKTSLTSAIKRNILSTQSSDQIETQNKVHQRKMDPVNDLSRRIERKVADGDIKNAFRLLTSEDTLAPDNEETLNILISKHPIPSRVINLPSAPENVVPFFVDEKMVLKAINNFKKGSAAGPDGIKPQFLKDMLSKKCGDAGIRLLKSITALMNFMLAGKLCHQICEYMYGAILIALKKKSGGIRPIAIGNVFRRLCARISCRLVSDRMASYFFPKQVGFSVRGGCEAAVHSARKFISSINSPRKILLKIDMENAFNTVERDIILTTIKEKLPELFPFVWQAYSRPSLLLYGSKIIMSQVGCQQGDPLGSLCFSLAIHPIVEKLQSEFNIFYLDDGTLGDDYKKVLDDFKSFTRNCKELGLKVNESKCELFIPMDSHREEITQKFREVAPNINILSESDLTLLGSPLSDSAAKTILSTKINTYKLLTERLKNIHQHTALFLLKNCLAIPMMTYLIRSAPLFQNTLLNELDNILKSSLEFILNTMLDDDHWNQATLPISLGGIGIRKLSHCAIPAYCSSIHSSCDMSNQIFPHSNLLDDQHLKLAETIWKNLSNENEIPTVASLQRNWDTPMSNKTFNNLNRDNIIDRARLLAVSQKESGDWLHAVPSPNLGTLLDPETLRIAVALRLGSKIYKSHTCRCGQIADTFGHHGLRCIKSSAGKFARHAALNDLAKRALLTAEIPSLLEPVDISRDDNSKRVDGVTIVPWSHGRQLAWDATCVDALCPSYVRGSARQACFAADKAAVKKRNNYRNVCSMYHFVPFAVDCLGGWSKDAKTFGTELGTRMRRCTDEPRSLTFFRQKVSLAIMRGNSACILGTIPADLSLSEVYYLR